MGRRWGSLSQERKNEKERLHLRQRSRSYREREQNRMSRENNNDYAMQNVLINVYRINLNKVLIRVIKPTLTCQETST